MPKWCNAGENDILRIYLRNETQNPRLFLGLYKNTTEPPEDGTLAGLTEQSGLGYARIALLPDDWNVVGDTATQPQKVFTASGGTWGQIYGYFITNAPRVSTTHRSRSSNVATIKTATPHFLSVGMQVIVSGVGGTGYNGTHTVASVPNSTTFTFSNTGSDESETADAGGIVTVAGSLIAVEHFSDGPYNIQDGGSCRITIKLIAS